MEIRLSSPNTFFYEQIEAIAKAKGCFASIRWSTPTQVRYVLVDRPGSHRQAPSEVQDQVIRAVLTLDQQATIRTARAVFEGLDDFEAQIAARVP